MHFQSLHQHLGEREKQFSDSFGHTYAFLYFSKPEDNPVCERARKIVERRTDKH
ncbi:hypothetical protein GJ744_011535 [Endocarpon pusillum]|uniref:Uncharacterized protein n=1 Tax=Endocarpon pusillum TaxID=364733 RepID=A0A8H7AGM7_9EURO|nr:hypothetical protein GJ744_011535 [Endocarpon pusillum]